jgi:hypothetical protein
MTFAVVGGDLACDLLDRYPTDFESRPNESTPSDYHTLPTPAERRTFEQRGNTFLRASWPIPPARRHGSVRTRPFDMASARV